MKIIYKRDKNIYYDLEIEFCCGEMEKWFDKDFIRCNCQNEIWIMGEEDYEYTFGERDPLFQIRYCPFCGKKIVYKETLKTRYGS